MHFEVAGTGGVIWGLHFEVAGMGGIIWGFTTSKF